MYGPELFARKKLTMLLLCVLACLALLGGRVAYIQIVQGPQLQELAYEQQTRDRLIAPVRGTITDRNGTGLALTKSVCSVSAIHAQLEDIPKTAAFLAQTLDLSYDTVLEKLEQRVALVRIKTKVEAETAEVIRRANLPGVVVDEDVKRIYPYGSLACQVIGFAGSDNQGVIGLEAKYDSRLKGTAGKILTTTDSKGLDVGQGQERIAPQNGATLITTLDAVVQQYAEQTLKKAVEAKGAKQGSIIVLDPRDGAILAMANYPDFDLNDPFTINNEALAATWDTLSQEEKSNALNRMWRNTALNDTYEPGSTFKIITMAAGLEEGVVNVNSPFYCSGAYVVADRRIKCWRSPRSHGSETFLQGVQNSCNPVFMQVAERLGAETFYDYLVRFGFLKKTGIDLSGEAVGILHKKENIGPVELATMSFGQSLQITPLQLMAAASAAVNGGYAITPHLGSAVADEAGNVLERFTYGKGEQILSSETSAEIRSILESVVAEGTGSKAYLPGYRVGGKTATSEKLPRSSNKYIASFLAFAPADDPQVMALVMIDEPQGVYYGGTVAGPVMKELLMNILPYLGITPVYTPQEAALTEVQKVSMPDFCGADKSAAATSLRSLGLSFEYKGEGSFVTNQFPPAGEEINLSTTVYLYLE